MGLLRSPRPDSLRLSSPAEPVIAVASHICRAPIHESTIQPNQQRISSLRDRAVAQDIYIQYVLEPVRQLNTVSGLYPQ